MTVIFSGNSNLFKSKVKIIGKTPVGNNKKDVKIEVLSKYLSSFWRFLEILFTNFNINLILTRSKVLFFSAT